MQQATEKALKAVLVGRGIRFRFVHDIGELITTLETHGISVPPVVRDATALTDYAVAARYPGPAEPVTEDDYRVALRFALDVVVWAEKVLTLPIP